MKIIDTATSQSHLDINHEELLIINAGLNEICNGIDVFEFETRIGANHERVNALLKKIGLLLDKIDPSDK